MFYPHTVYKEYGQHLDEMNINEMYDELVENPNVRKTKGSARKLLEKLAILRYESGYPYIMFQDNVNKVHANNHISQVKFSNLCSEVLESSKVSKYTDYDQEDEIGLDISCNLGSMNILNVMNNQSIEKTVRTAVDALTRITDATNIVNAPAVNKANKTMKSIGLGQMNLHGYLAQNGIPYESEAAIDFANTYFMMVNFYSLKRSMEIAKETGETYYMFEGSTYKSGSFLISI